MLVVLSPCAVSLFSFCVHEGCTDQIVTDSDSHSMHNLTRNDPTHSQPIPILFRKGCHFCMLKAALHSSPACEASWSPHASSCFLADVEPVDTKKKGEQRSEWANQTGEQQTEWANQTGEQQIEWANHTGEQLIEWANQTGEQFIEWANHTGEQQIEWANHTGEQRIEWAEYTGEQRSEWANREKCALTASTQKKTLAVIKTI